MFIKFLSCVGVLGLVACQTISSDASEIRLEAEIGYKNIVQNYFVIEENDFYSGGAAVMMSGYAPVGSTGMIEYDLNARVPAGTYTLKVHYNDENDGHSPIDVWVDEKAFSFVMDAATPSAFADIANQRSVSFKNVRVGKESTLKVRGTVHRYNSEHKELVRLDYFEFSPEL